MSPAPLYQIVCRAPGESHKCAMPSAHSRSDGMPWSSARDAFEQAGWYNKMVYTLVQVSP